MFRVVVLFALVAVAVAGYAHSDRGYSPKYVTRKVFHHQPHHHQHHQHAEVEEAKPVEHHQKHEEEHHDQFHDFYAPINYKFEYGVKDPHTGDHKTHWEERTGDVVKGAYTVLDADGSSRLVEYTADPHHGFNAVVKKIEHAHVPAKEQKPAPVVDHHHEKAHDDHSHQLVQQYHQEHHGYGHGGYH
ncbi:cuticle protein 19-like [Anopheles bellator]|uniref:cuticle protein 19-like n=1 Tax=Anopheles bellator TaxID=139047 RepID=UPI002649471F|nr:cuticle protein 19-like [Anopheles bellator]